MVKTAAKKKVEELSYEEAFSELSEIITTLESETHALDEALMLYARGQALARRCAVLLEQAELKVHQLSEEEPQTVNGELDP